MMTALVPTSPPSPLLSATVHTFYVPTIPKISSWMAEVSLSCKFWQSMIDPWLLGRERPKERYTWNVELEGWRTEAPALPAKPAESTWSISECSFMLPSFPHRGNTPLPGPPEPQLPVLTIKFPTIFHDSAATPFRDIFTVSPHPASYRLLLMIY